MKQKITIGLGILLGIMMLNSGLNKFFNYMELPKMSEEAGNLMHAFAQAKWLFPLIATVEILGGLFIAIPKTNALGAIMLLPITVGIFLFHATLDPSSVIVSIILLLFNVTIIVSNKNKYIPMIGVNHK